MYHKPQSYTCVPVQVETFSVTNKTPKILGIHANITVLSSGLFHNLESVLGLGGIKILCITNLAQRANYVTIPLRARSNPSPVMEDVIAGSQFAPAARNGAWTSQP